jgi:hypothetical protein
MKEEAISVVPVLTLLDFALTSFLILLYQNREFFLAVCNAEFDRPK